jgi:hypothetical protein
LRGAEAFSAMPPQLQWQTSASAFRRRENEIHCFHSRDSCRFDGFLRSNAHCYSACCIGYGNIAHRNSNSNDDRHSNRDTDRALDGDSNYDKDSDCDANANSYLNPD